MKRFLTGVIVGVIALLLLIVQGPLFRIAAAIVNVLAVWEMCNAFRSGGRRISRVLPVIFSVLTLPVYKLLGFGAMVPLLGVFIALSFMCMIFTGETGLEYVANTTFAMMYPGLLITLFYPLLDIEGALYVRFVSGTCLAVAMLSDVFAFLVGKRFGKKKLCPVISPKKTVEGALGGILGAVFAVPFTDLVCRLITGDWTTSLPFVPFLLAAIFAGVVSELGDLAASIVKRECGIKDYSSVLPGHGGIMDRIDSILFCTIVFNILTMYIL